MTSRNYTWIGARTLRPEGPDKVRGAFPYLADSPWPDMLYGIVVFSPIAHGVVKRFDSSKALELPGVIVLGPDDAPPNKYNSGEWFPDQKDFPDETVLTAHVKHVGDRVALVLAPDEAVARRAAALVEVEYDELPAYISLDDAEAGAESLHGDGQPCFPGRLGYGDFDAAAAAADRIHSSEIYTPKIHHAAMETHCVLALPRPGKCVEVHSPCQILYGVQHAVAQVVDLPLSRIRVIKAPMGGTFGGKQEVVFEPLCAWAALKVRRPVFIDTNRAETIVSTRTRAATLFKMTTTLDAEDRITARRIEVTADAGAYLSGTKKVLMSMGKKVSRLYRIPSFAYEGKVVRTTTTPAGACRGYGSPQIHTATEIHTDLLCRDLGLDSVEFRLKNLVTSEDRDLGGGAPLGGVHVSQCLTRGAELFDWEHRKEPTTSGRFRTASGFACCTHGNGYGSTVYHDFVGMSLRFLEDGSLLLRTGIHELGNGTLTSMAQIVAEVTRISPDLITVTEGDTYFSGYDVGCQASRVIYVCGECARLAAEKVVAMLCEEGEKLLDTTVSLIEDGKVQLGSGEEMDIGHLVRQLLLKRSVSIDVQQDYRPVSNPASYGAHFAQVKIDTYTGLAQVTDYLAVHDIGQAINTSFVEGQIYGGVQMGIGMALVEDLSYDAKGRPSATNFDKYHMVNMPDMPPVKVELIEGFEPGGPFGAKSIGEICTVPVSAAVVNAVNRALGTSMTDLPLTPARIVSALAELENSRR